MTTAGLMGWALASTLKDGRYLRLIPSFLLAVLLHAIWNGLTLLLTIGPYLNDNNFLKSLGFVSPIGLLVMMAMMLAALLGWNRILNRQTAA